MEVSQVVTNAADTVRSRPVLAVGVVGGLAVLVYVARRNKSGQDQDAPGPAFSAPADFSDPNGITPGDGMGTIPPLVPPGGTPKDPAPQPGSQPQPGPILGPSLRITDADRAAYMCDEGKYLRYGRGANAGKIVCVNRVTRAEGPVILKGTGARAH